MKCESIENGFRKNYLLQRSSILHSRYGVPKEVLCSRSRSVSLRGVSVSNNADGKSNLTSSQEERCMEIRNILDHVALCFSI